LSFFTFAKVSLHVLYDPVIYVICFGAEFVNSGGFSAERRTNHIIWYWVSFYVW